MTQRGRSHCDSRVAVRARPPEPEAVTEAEPVTEPTTGYFTAPLPFRFTRLSLAPLSSLLLSRESRFGLREWAVRVCWVAVWFTQGLRNRRANSERRRDGREELLDERGVVTTLSLWGGMNHTAEPNKRFHTGDVALEIVGALAPLVGVVARGDSDLRRQIRRAAASIPLNVAEAI